MRTLIYLTFTLFFFASLSGCKSYPYGLKFDPLENAIPLSKLNEERNPSRKVAQEFPYDIRLATLNDKVALSSDVFQRIDAPLVVSFWLTTCGPCKKELREMTANYPKWREETDFRFVAISTDFPKNKHRIKEIAEKEQYNFEVYWDMFKEYRLVIPGQLNGLPQIFIFGKDGEILWHKKRFRPGDTELLYAKVKEISKGF